ncbi:MAG: carbohydrate kinase [Acidobacteriota bacterium]
MSFTDSSLTNKDPKLFVGIGELLWDQLPNGKKLGGAPANFAYHAAQLGNLGIIASRIGVDLNGKEALAGLQENDLDTQYIQIDKLHPTGTVDVEVDACGQPNFIINSNVAWDFLEFTAQWQALAAQADVICFGTLAQRSAVSKDSISEFLKASKNAALKIFDVNLRKPFYTFEVIEEALNLANLLKVNEQEFHYLANLFAVDGGDELAIAKRLLDRHNLKMVCVTKGASGSLLVTENNFYLHHGLSVTVRDAVGAGDAFTAAMAHHYLRGSSLEKISKAANRLGSWVATQAGATPRFSLDVLQEII